MKNYGMLQVYTGTGKGKTTAALGVAFRAVAKGARVKMFSFMKGDPTYGEAIGAALLPGFELEQVGRDEFVNFVDPEQIDIDMAQAGWEKAKQAILSGTVDIVILDEINLLLHVKLLDTASVVSFLKQSRGNVEVICTGRCAPPELCEAADLITDMREIKHYYQKDVTSREGIDH